MPPAALPAALAALSPALRREIAEFIRLSEDGPPSTPAHFAAALVPHDAARVPNLG